jgi:hypothetical protein
MGIHAVYTFLVILAEYLKLRRKRDCFSKTAVNVYESETELYRRATVFGVVRSRRVKSPEFRVLVGRLPTYA